jgi:acetyl esterase/lipase
MIASLIVALLLQQPFSVAETRDILFADAPVKPAGSTKPLHLDLYEPEDDGVALRPAVILVHGGGFTRGDKRAANMVQLARNLAGRGYVCISIDYRVEGDQPDVEGPTPRHQAILGSMQDTSVALEWMLNNARRYRIDPNRIAMAGASAGATSVLLAGLGNPAELPPVRVVIDMWGGLGGPVSMIAKGKPAILIVHGTADKSVPFSEAQKISKQAAKEGVPYKLIAVDGAGHGVDLSLPFEGKPIYDHIAAFLAAHN